VEEINGDLLEVDFPSPSASALGSPTQTAEESKIPQLFTRIPRIPPRVRTERAT